MADLSDVETALVRTIDQILYPGGTAVPSVTGGLIKIFRGWPTPIGLNADLGVGISSVSIFSDPKMTKNTTRYPQSWGVTAATPPTLKVTTNGYSVTFSGTGGDGQVAGLLINDKTYTVAVRSTDTPLSVATSFALITGAEQNGTTLTISSAFRLIARVVGGGTAAMETRRQEQGIVISIWCADPDHRDSIAASIDAALSRVDWLQFPDGSAGLLRYRHTSEVDTSENANLYRRDLTFTVDYPTVITQRSSDMIFGSGAIDAAARLSSSTSPYLVTRPRLGAIRFDAWYDPRDSIDQQCAAALSQPQWADRLPANAVVSNGQVSWPLAEQSTLDDEILAAVAAGLSFWAFDSFKPSGGLNRALGLFLASQYRSKIGFCMLGQTSNWSDPSTSTGYSDILSRDISMMSESGYVTVIDGRPLYFVLDASSSQTAYLPSGGVAGAIAYIRRQVTASGAGNPYVVWLSGSALADYNNITAAQQVGADAAGAYACPRLSGTAQPYSALTATTENDWRDRLLTGMDMVPTGMTGWDQRPLVERPQPFYPVNSDLTPSNYYEAGTVSQIAAHATDLVTFVSANPAACPSGVALLYAWNELVEGGWITPSLGQSGPDCSRVDAVGQALSTWVPQSVSPTIFNA